MREICGDIKASVLDKLIYFACNFARDIWDLIYLPERHYFVRYTDENISICNWYFHSFLIDRLSKYIKKRGISIIDIGCGRGNVRKYLQKAGYSGKYIGVDINNYKEFSNYNDCGFDSKLIKCNAEDYNYETCDITISGAALEHIEKDELVISKIRSDLQIHYVPSGWGLFLFLRHGWRQYTKRMIKQKFGDCEIFELGGLFSFMHTFFTITLFQVFRLERSEMFRVNINLLNKLDRLLPIMPYLYIIVKRRNG